MSERARRPTEEGTGVPRSRDALLGASPGDRIAGESESWDQDATELMPRTSAVEHATQRSTPEPRIEQATPTELTARAERSEPIRVISMKAVADPGRRRGPAGAERQAPPHVQLRSMAEVAGHSDRRNDLGRLAPPRDPRQARRRRRRDNVVWACVAIALAGAISLGIWLVAGR